jgi:hypothetical protein
MKYNEFFKSKIRTTTQEKFVCLKDNAPEELTEIIREIHLNFGEESWANDWLYEIIRDAFVAIEVGYDESADLDVIQSDLECDVYTKDIIDWLHNSFAIDIVEDIKKECRDIGFLKLIEIAQIEAKRNVYTMVYEFINENKEEK